jgi:septal ring factor EnvC (AmiA/AmiB activator)
MSIEQVANIVDTAIHKLPHMENLYRQAKDQAEKMQHTIQRLANDIRALEHKISILDKIAFSSEQDCKRTEQRVQELIDQKNRMERLIANILNGEGYSKVKQVAKENVRAVLSDNKMLISTAFATMIQTLKDDPQMVKLIQNIPSANDGEQNKDNNNNSIKCLEANNNILLDLAEKYYENLVEVLTSDAVSSASASSSNPTLSSPQSSSTFSNLSNQSDVCRIEESELIIIIVKEILLIDLMTQ